MRIKSGKLLGILYMMYGTGWTILSLVGVIVFIVLGFTIDLRFFVLALIWVFLIIPMIVVFLYIYYGMKPLTAMNCIEHELECNSSGCKVIVANGNEDEESNKEKREYDVEMKDCKGMKMAGEYVIMDFGKQGILIKEKDGKEILL